MTESGSVNLLLNHAHTPYSNNSSKERACNNHHTDYLEVLKVAPEGVGIVAVRTEHYESDPEYFDDLEEKVEDEDGFLRKYDKHVAGEVYGKNFAIVNGCEISLEQENWHVVLGGLDLDYNERNMDVSEEKLFRLGREKAEWIAPAHYKVPGFLIPETRIENIFETAEEEDFEVAVNIPTGYSPFINNMGRGTMTRLGNRLEDSAFQHLAEKVGISPGRTLKDWSEEYDIPMVPELDTHSILPEKFDGTGLIRDEDIMYKLLDGDLPVDSLLDVDIVSYNGRSGGFSPFGEGLTHFEFFQTLPGPLNKFGNLYDRLLQHLPLIPGSEEEFRELWEEKVVKLEGAELGEIKGNSYSPKDLLI